MEDLVFAIIVFIFGIMIGSFLNVLIYRIPKGENIAFPASHCQSCLTPLKWYHNIPIFSWLFLRGKCGFCGEKISIQYPIIEFITGLIAIALFYKLGLNWQLPIVFIVFSLLFALVMIDFKYMAVPDNLNYLALAFALIQPNYLDAIINALIAGGSIAILRIILTKILKKEAMGEGDIPVIATMGALLGFPLFFVALFLSALLAMLPSLLARDKMVPFVPFLAMGTFIVYIFDTQALELLQWVIYG
ncbi:MAG: prepilin peptidase [Sulfurovum sp.]|nr:MAG: prepilin peptidase [Sulfurovum sp.]